MGEQHGWVVKLRSTYPAETRQDPEINLEAVSAGVFLAVQASVKDYQGL
jgi:hypothetical protein